MYHMRAVSYKALITPAGTSIVTGKLGQYSGDSIQENFSLKLLAHPIIVHHKKNLVLDSTWTVASDSLASVSYTSSKHFSLEF